MNPMIYIVGAGPGNPDLLTIRAYKLLTEIAEVVIYDRLISEEILALIPKSVPKIYVGKSCNSHAMTQDEINVLLIEKSGEYDHVVRLKGGDPFIFGRGGEEVQYIQRHHVPYEIVSGVNAADGCATSLGIPLTHREYADGVRFITGHRQSDKHLSLDWPCLVHPTTTLVIFMGLVHLKEIAEQLLKYGLDEATPAVAIESGTLTTMRYCFAPLRELFQRVSDEGLKAPTIVIIGQVVALSPQYEP